jgi:hypothetical protein
MAVIYEAKAGQWAKQRAKEIHRGAVLGAVVAFAVTFVIAGAFLGFLAARGGTWMTGIVSLAGAAALNRRTLA